MSSASIVDNEKVTRLTMSPALVDELHGLLQFNQRYDTIIVDCTLEGFFFPADDLLRVYECASELLNVKGALLFAKPDQVLVLIKETPMSDVSFHTFSSLSQLYDFSASLARQLQADNGRSLDVDTDISDQIIMSTIPVLTKMGIDSKSTGRGSSKRRKVLLAIDNYSSISAVATRLATTHEITIEELKEELRYLEKDQLIFPIFPKVRFLAECLRNGTYITIKDYLVASGLIPKEKLDELLMKSPSGNPDTRLGIGPLCVNKEYFSSRLLEIIMYELALYGGGSQKPSEELINPAEQLLVQSLVGQLGNTDPAGLLQSLSSDRRSGILTVEHLNRQFQCVYDQGRVTHAKLADIRGDNALIEFVATWRVGIFVFIQRDPRPDLIADACKLTRPLDKLLLNAALDHDNQELVWKKLPHGMETPVEKLPDNNSILQQNDLVNPATGQQFSTHELQVMRKLWQAADGLSPVIAVTHRIGDITATDAASALDSLLLMNLIAIPESNISAALQGFRQIAYAAGERLGAERNSLMLKVSLQSTHGYSTSSRMFIVGSLGEIGIDLGAARSAGFSASQILSRLEDWQVKYVECLCQEIDLDLLKNIVYKVHAPARQSNPILNKPSA
jgi:hypothetical protein